MKITFRSRFSNTLAFVFAVATLQSLSASVHSQPAPKKVLDTLAAREAKGDWTQAKLTLDNSAYAATRAHIDTLIRQGQKPADLESFYRLKGNDRNNAQKIFRWAYAAYRKQKLNPQTNGLLGIGEAMNRNQEHGAYDWMRLRFLVASLQTFLRPTMPLIKVGRRLLEVKRDDEEVMFHFVLNLQNSQSLADRKQAVSLARENANKHPRDVHWQWQIAGAVSGVNGFAGRPTPAGNQAETIEYKKTLQMLPLGHPYRQRLIDKIVRLDIEFDANGKRANPTYNSYQEALKNTTLR